MGLKIVRELPIDVWKSFVLNHPQGNIYHTPEMFEVWRQTKGFLPELWAAVDGPIVKALFVSVHITLSNIPIKALATRAVIFGGVICEAGVEGLTALRELLRNYQQRSRRISVFTEIRNVYELGESASMLESMEFKYEGHLNYLVNLDRPMEEIVNSIHSRARKHIRQAIKKGKVRVEEVTDPEKISICYELLLSTFNKAHVPLSDISLFQGAFDQLVRLGMARYTLAYVNDEPVAVSICLLYKKYIIFWYAGSIKKFSSESPNEILILDSLEWGNKNGYHIYDFGGAGKPDEEYGVRDFKSKFGGDLVSFGRNVWTARPVLLGFSKAAYSILRAFLYKA